MAYEVIILGHLHMPLYFLETFTESSYLLQANNTDMIARMIKYFFIITMFFLINIFFESNISLFQIPIIHAELFQQLYPKEETDRYFL